MQLKFKTIILHNFLSFAHAEINLENKGYCLVSGRNMFKKDNAFSNGSGKSSIWSGICYALIGETIQGVKSNLKNINVDDTECYVTLYFRANNDEYEITRQHSPKSNLFIKLNGADISGKGIRESSIVLAERLPDLNKDLIASSILLGQGLPNKLSSFSPSGRKELLEQLAKTDYMIEDIKTRISNRQSALNTQVRKYEDELLKLSTTKTMIEEALVALKAKQTQAVRPNFEELATTKTNEITVLEKNLAALTNNFNDNSAELNKVNGIILSFAEQKQRVVQESLNQYMQTLSEHNTHANGLNGQINGLAAEINRLKSIRDVCPTCGQKLPGILKPDTTKQEQEIAELRASLNTVNKTIENLKLQHQANMAKHEENFNLQVSETKTKLNALQQINNSIRTELANNNAELIAKRSELNRIALEKDNWDKTHANLEQEIQSKEQTLQNCITEFQATSTKKNEIDEHCAIVRKMETLVKRDFRSFLLTNVIQYLNAKAKEYSKIVFGTDEIELTINGNALDISYCGKMIDSLSGGEQTRVDLILQLALRAMLQTYLNFKSNIIVLDECTDFLDRQSCGAVMNLLTAELSNVESVFIISHHAESLDLPFESELRVIKNTNGISEATQVIN